MNRTAFCCDFDSLQLLSIAVIILAIGQGIGSILPPYDLSIIDLTAILESPFLLIPWAIMAGKLRTH